MYKIKLVLADFDGSYLDRVTGFVSSSSYGAGMRVSSFTDVQRLADFLASGGEKGGILLAHPDFINTIPDIRRYFELVVILSDDRVNGESQDCHSVFKYQPGDKMIGFILELYSEQNPGAARAVSGVKESRLIAVYSPAGGVGKTSVAFALAARMADYGSSVLYLNWESINSMAAVLPGTGECGMTRILLGLEEDPETLPLKFELYKKRVSGINVDFFEPPESFVEFSDFQGDLGVLFTKLKGTGIHDTIVVDLDSALSSSTIRILSLGDLVILVLAPDHVCRYKTGEFLRQAWHSGIFPDTVDPGKLLPVANRANNGSTCPDKADLAAKPDFAEGQGLQVKFSLPYIPDLWTQSEGRLSFDPGQILRSAIDPLVRELISGQG